MPMHLFGLDPDLAGVSQDPSLLELSDIKNAKLSPEKYFQTSQYGLQEDLMEKGPFGNINWLGCSISWTIFLQQSLLFMIHYKLYIDRKRS